MKTSGVLWDQEHPHPSEDVLERYAMSHADLDEAERVEEHLFLCSECRDSLDKADQWIAFMKSALSPQDNPVSGYPLIEKLVRFFSPQPRECRERDDWSLWSIRNLWGVPTLRWSCAAAAGIAMLFLLPARSHLFPVDQQQVALLAMRGNDPRVKAVASKPFRFLLGEPGLESLSTGNRLTIVSSTGSEVWSCNLTSDRTVHAPALQPGDYWIRILTPSGEALKEYGVIVR
jgi:hypothetical protein